MGKTFNIGHVSITNTYFFAHLLKYVLGTWVHFKSALVDDKRREYVINLKFTVDIGTAIEANNNL
jgi:hypothetical protein